MENASKALLIAGGVFITILVLSTGIYLYTQFSKQSKEYNSMMSAIELQKFNSEFDVFVGKNNITAQELVTVVNRAREYDNLVEIIIYNKGYNKEVFDTSEKFVVKFLNSSFSCIDSEYNNIGKIIKLTFKENS